MLASGYFFKVLRIDAFQQKQRETGRVSPESKTGTDRTHSSHAPFLSLDLSTSNCCCRLSVSRRDSRGLINEARKQKNHSSEHSQMKLHKHKTKTRRRL